MRGTWTDTNTKARGMIMCCSDDMAFSAFAAVNRTRKHLDSKLSIVIMHCSELSNSSINMLLTLESVSVMDICSSNPNNIIPHDFLSIASKDRLQGFYCKPAALIASPFQETIVVDVDVIWFEKPELLFDAPGYHSSGALFFRDRLFYEYKGQPKSSLNFTMVKKYIEYHIQKTITPNDAMTLSRAHGESYYWRYLAHKQEKPYQHIQDSSVIVFDSKRHPLTIQFMKNVLSSFSLGYGDKELYWIAVTITGENFAWEPFLPGIYGDCGAMFHFDPRHPKEWLPTPFYMNSEYILECSTFVGEYLENTISKPVPVNPQTKLFTMGKGSPRTSGLCDACKVMKCMPTPNYINKEIRIAQSIEINRPNRIKKSCMMFKQRHSAYMPFAMVEDGPADPPPEVLEALERIRNKYRANKGDENENAN